MRIRHVRPYGAGLHAFRAAHALSAGALAVRTGSWPRLRAVFFPEVIRWNSRITTQR
ncbi:hypothetical protein XAB3213_1020005 [Xanthomonas citri pv. bilvae]|nr:hypothetical protein XAB3213_1020005 [Xanthomonas citri pv. bilvae]